MAGGKSHLLFWLLKLFRRGSTMNNTFVSNVLKLLCKFSPQKKTSMYNDESSSLLKNEFHTRWPQSEITDTNPNMILLMAVIDDIVLMFSAMNNTINNR